MPPSDHQRDSVATQGYAIVEDVLPESEVISLLAALDEESGAETAASQRGGAVYAVRNLLSASPAVQAIARSAAVRRLMEPFLGADCFAVRAILFDKVPGANWNLGWHQDLSIAVQERPENSDTLSGWGPWSVKAGTVHVQPPFSLLERMLTIRLHLDDCGPDNGPLRVLPGSHAHGRLDAAQIANLRAKTAEVTCIVPRGGAVLMRPLLLHASSAAITPGHRRVLHIEFAAEQLPHGLRWSDTVR